MSIIRTTTAVLIAVAVFAQVADAVEPVCREIRASVDVGMSTPSGEWGDLVKSGGGFGADLGISLSRRLTTGFTFSYYDSEPSDSYEPAAWIDISGHQWSLYTYEAFAEYLLSEDKLSPFVGGHLGIHFTHIDYIYLPGDERSMGDHGIGYALSAGVQYRINQRTGVHVRLSGRQTPGLYSGWRTSAHVGCSLFM